MDAVLAIEQVALVCPRSADVVQAGNFGAIRTFSEYAGPAQKERYPPALLKGEALNAVGMTEPDAGSAVTDHKTTATPDGAGFRKLGRASRREREVPYVSLWGVAATIKKKHKNRN